MSLISIGRLFFYLRYNWLQILLIILSIYDLRIDLRILIDFFTFSTLFYTISEHPLALTILISSPYLINQAFLLVIDNNEGANAILDQAPVITPINKANANQYNVDPPQINIHINGRSVVRLVYLSLIHI